MRVAVHGLEAVHSNEDDGKKQENAVMLSSGILLTGCALEVKMTEVQVQKTPRIKWMSI